MTGLAMAGGLGVVTLFAAGPSRPCESPAAERVVGGSVDRCHPLTAWTVRLASGQLVQYPPGVGEPYTF